MKHRKTLEIRMPYLSTLSVNSAYNRGDPKLGHKPEVDIWLLALKTKLNFLLDNKNYLKINEEDGVELNIGLEIKTRPGRRPDTSNFRKLPQDVIADCLEVDDWIFYGEDLRLKEGDNEIVFTITWEHSSNGRDIITATQSKMHAGPLTSFTQKVMGLKGEFCIGLGSTYCVKCSALEYCPVEFSPDVYTEVPCEVCNIVCPCKGKDAAYETRKQLIEEWWKRR